MNNLVIFWSVVFKSYCDKKLTLRTSVGLASELDTIPATTPQHTLINSVDSERHVSRESDHALFIVVIYIHVHEL